MELRHLVGMCLALVGSAAFSSSAWALIQTRTSSFAYDASGRLVKEVIEPDSSDLCLVTEYSYDAYGNRITATTRNCNGSSGEAAAPTGGSISLFTARTTYTYFDISAGCTTPPSYVAGRLPVRRVNALGHAECLEHDAKFGAPAKLTGPNGLATLWTYDTFGRRSRETRADGSYTDSVYAVASGFTHPGGAVLGYQVTQTTKNSGGTISAPTQVIYFDVLDRKVGIAQTSFDGTTQARLEVTGYDNVGRVSKLWRPYFASAGAGTYTQYVYDVLGRVTQQTEPSGLVKTNSYAGLATTTTVDPDGAGSMPAQTQLTTKNSQGQVVSVRTNSGAAGTVDTLVSFLYDPFGNLTQTTDPLGNVTALTYDLRGRKSEMVDRDMGRWTYRYNALGELAWQCEPVSRAIQSVSGDCADAVASRMTYDKLGRMLSRTERDLTSTWTWDTATKGVGKLAQVTSINSYSRTHAYDTLGRPSSITVTIGSDTFTHTSTYDTSGRLDTLTYPDSVGVQHQYNAQGYLYRLYFPSEARVAWEALELTASGGVKRNALHQDAGTMKVVRDFDTAERLTRIRSGGDPTNNGITDYQYTYALNGNVTQKLDARNSVTENFSYDQLNRLLSSSGTSTVTRSFTYDKLGNITYRSDVGTYAYPASGSSSVRPHAVSSVTAPTTAGVGGISASYGYDAAGALMTASGTVESPNEAVSVAFSRALAYMSFGLPNVICEARGSGAASQVLYSGGAATDCQNTGGASQYRYTYTYGPDHERVKLVAQRPDDTVTTLYVHPGGAGELLFEKESRASNGYSETKRYLSAYGETFAIYVKKSTGTSEWRYLHRDTLGSVAAITGKTGSTLETLSYEAFGERRYVSGARQDRTSPLLGVLTDRGFTIHEHLDEINLIHMNGRIFDPALARFMTPDPLVQAQNYSQAYNRYSYGLNNPLRSIDPSGFLSLSSLLDDIGDFIDGGGWFHILVGIAFGPGFGDAGNIAGLKSPIAIGVMGGFAVGISASEGNLAAGVRGAAAGALFGWASRFAPGTPASYAAHAVAGCASGGLQSGGCDRGALSAVAGKWVTVNSEQLLGKDLRFVGPIAAGGVASWVSGGNFQNGAVTAAFGYLFNHCSHGNCTTPLEQTLYDWMPGYKAGTLLYNQTMGDGSWTGWEVLDAASVGAGVAGRGLQALQGLRAGTVGVEFGANANQVSHAFRHIDAVGLPRDAVMTAIRADIPALQVGQGVTRSVTVNGTELTYRANRISESVVNVGRITPPRP